MMDNDGTPPGLTWQKASGKHCAPGKAAFCGQKNRQIPQMMGVQLARQAPMGSGAVKGLLDRTAAFSLVQMQSKKTAGRQAFQLCNHNRASGRPVQQDIPGQALIARRAGNDGRCLRWDGKNAGNFKHTTYLLPSDYAGREVLDRPAQRSREKSVWINKGWFRRIRQHQKWEGF